MSKKSDPAVIGIFVLGALALTIIAALLFGGSDALKKKATYVSYFSGSVKGLRVGSNVLFRGVRVGYVTDIKLIASLDSLETSIPVIYEIDPDKFRFMQGDVTVSVQDYEAEQVSIDQWIQAGLRAQLDSESFVTGQLMIELDFQPDTEAVFENRAIPHPEIPSVTSGITQAIEDAQRFVSELQKEIDVEELSAKIGSILDGVDELANSEELRRTLTGLDQLVNSEDTQQIPEELLGAVASTRTLVDKLDGEVVGVVKGLASTLAQAEALLSAASAQIDDESMLSVQLSSTLTEVSDAARSIRVLADYLEQHPEAIIKGKK